MNARNRQHAGLLRVRGSTSSKMQENGLLRVGHVAAALLRAAAMKDVWDIVTPVLAARR